MQNPSSTHQEPWSTRPSFQDRLTLYSEHPRRVIGTLIHVQRMSDADLRLIKAVPVMARALQLADEALFAVAGNKPNAQDLLTTAALETRKALGVAGLLHHAENTDPLPDVA